jgi:hypothetical protein
MLARFTAMVLACSVLAVAGVPSRASEPFSWQEAHARVLPQDELEWLPRPFR